MIKAYYRGNEVIELAPESIAFHTVDDLLITSFDIPDNCNVMVMALVNDTFLSIAASLERMGMNLEYPSDSLLAELESRL